jgi:hypothetical protein
MGGRHVSPWLDEIGSERPYATRRMRRTILPADDAESTFRRTVSVPSLGKGSAVRVLGIVASVSGLLLATVAFLSWAANSLPYQDATVELLKGQRERAAHLGLVMLLGMAIAVAGGFCMWRSWRRGEK